MTALEQSLADLTAEHGLESLSITVMTPTDLGRSWFDVNVQWLRHGVRQIATGNNPHSLAQALGNALASMHSQRGSAEPVALADGPLLAEVA